MVRLLELLGRTPRIRMANRDWSPWICLLGLCGHRHHPPAPKEIGARPYRSEKTKSPSIHRRSIQGLPPCGCRRRQHTGCYGALHRPRRTGDQQIELSKRKKVRTHRRASCSRTRSNPYAGSGFPESRTRTKSAVHSRTSTTVVIQDSPARVVISMEHPTRSSGSLRVSPW